MLRENKLMLRRLLKRRKRRKFLKPRRGSRMTGEIMSSQASLSLTSEQALRQRKRRTKTALQAKLSTTMRMTPRIKNNLRRKLKVSYFLESVS